MTSLTRTIRFLALGGIAAVLALGALVAVPSSSTAAAPDAQHRAGRNYFGAIAISVDRAAAYSYDYATKRAARRAALNKCRNNSNYPGRCRVSVWVRNGCAATAVKVNSDGFVTRYASGIARTRRKAESRAKSQLARPRFVVAWVCTTR